MKAQRAPHGGRVGGERKGDRGKGERVQSLSKRYNLPLIFLGTFLGSSGGAAEQHRCYDSASGSFEPQKEI